MNDFFKDCEPITIKVKGLRLPEIIIPQHYYKKLGIDQATKNDEFLKILCRSGLKDKNLLGQKEYITRLKYEFSIIDEIGFIDYFLLVWDVINFCKENDIPVGKGRGSAAGSLILYLIGVTGIDPIQNKLIFERFISRARAKSQIIDGIRYIDGDMAPDVDLDICTDRREEVIAYLKEKYSGKFCKLPTIYTLATRQAVKDVSKIFGRFSEDQINLITKMIPVKFGQPSSIEDSIKESESFAQFAKENEDIIDCALTLEDMMRQKGGHASAYLIGHDLFDSYLPCELDGSGEVVCSFDMHYAQKETIKLDLLGLHGVTLVANIEKSLGMKFDDFDPNDPEVYALSQSGDLPYGLFQIGADANFRVFRKVKPQDWEGLSAVIALARPGALAYVDEYCENQFNDYFGHTVLQEILSKTHNVPLYQEQALAIAHRVFFFSLEEAELIRRAVGKKKPEEIAKWKEKIYEAGKQHSIREEICDFYWKLLEESANYSFNASHSFSYSYLSALTLYLKYKYPQHFYTECLNMEVNKADSQENIARIQQELSFFGIELLAPDLIKSKENFAIENGGIRYGFSSIKGVSEKSLSALKAFLKTEKTDKFGVFNAAENNKLNIGIVCALIQSGMLSTLSTNREKLVFEAQLWGKLTDKEKMFCLENGKDYDYDLITMVKNIHSWTRIDGKKVAAKTRLETIKKNIEPYKAIYHQNVENKALANYFYETALLGYSYSSTLKGVFKNKRPSILNVMELKNAWEKANVEGVFRVSEVKKGVSGRGNKYCKVVFQDETGSFDGMMVGDKYEVYAKKHPDPVAGDIVFVMGQKGPEIVWLNSMAIQTHKIFLKLADLK
jgi:DNA polymerase-3 subunit alpha